MALIEAAAVLISPPYSYMFCLFLFSKYNDAEWCDDWCDLVLDAEWCDDWCDLVLDAEWCDLVLDAEWCDDWCDLVLDA